MKALIITFYVLCASSVASARVLEYNTNCSNYLLKKRADDNKDIKPEPKIMLEPPPSGSDDNKRPLVDKPMPAPTQNSNDKNDLKLENVPDIKGSTDFSDVPKLFNRPMLDAAENIMNKMISSMTKTKKKRRLRTKSKKIRTSIHKITQVITIVSEPTQTTDKEDNRGLSNRPMPEPKQSANEEDNRELSNRPMPEPTKTANEEDNRELSNRPMPAPTQNTGAADLRPLSNKPMDEPIENANEENNRELSNRPMPAPTQNTGAADLRPLSNKPMAEPIQNANQENKQNRGLFNKPMPAPTQTASKEKNRGLVNKPMPAPTQTANKQENRGLFNKPMPAPTQTASKEKNRGLVNKPMPAPTKNTGATSLRSLSNKPMPEPLKNNTESADELQKLFDILAECCKRWDMNVNIKKCGIMAINCSTNTTFKIQNQLIPSLYGMLQYPKKKQYSIKIQRMVIKAIIQAVATYGGKLFGMPVTRFVVISLSLFLIQTDWIYIFAGIVLERENLLLADTEAGTSCNWMGLELVYPELKPHINSRRYAKSGFIEKRFIEEFPFCRNIAPETIEHMLLECSRWQALRADILAQYINIYRAQVATKPPLLPASISMRLVGKLLGEELKLSSTRIRKDPTYWIITNLPERIPTGYGDS
ncbi:hypothetical protein BB561_005590, partial [Smittium simulii]